MLALLVGGLGLTAAALAFAVAQHVTRVMVVDARHEVAGAAADGAVRDAVDRLVWGGLPAAWAGEEVVLELTDASHGVSTVTVRPAGMDGVGRGYIVEAVAQRGGATAARRVRVRVVPLRLPAGFTCADDLHVGAPLSLVGCGAYVGGDVAGREWIELPDGEPPDLVRGDEWPVAAVHAGGRIHAGSVEVHEAGVAAPYDTDLCVGGGGSPAAGWPPGAAWWANVTGNSDRDVVPASVDTLDLGVLAEIVDGRSFPAPATGPVVVVRPPSGELRVTGEWPLDEGRPQLTLVVRGDCVLGGTDAGKPGTVLRGALLVEGALVVCGPSVVAGFVAAREASLEAGLSVVVESGWRSAPPPGSCVAIVASEDRGDAAGGGDRTERQGELRGSSPAGCARSVPNLSQETGGAGTVVVCLHGAA